MNTCETCKAYKVCDHDRFGFENCGSYNPEWISVDERLPDEQEDVEGEKHTVSDIVQVAVQTSLGMQFVTDDMLYDGEWVNFNTGEFEITHWKPMPEPPNTKGGAE